MSAKKPFVYRYSGNRMRAWVKLEVMDLRGRQPAIGDLMFMAGRFRIGQDDHTRIEMGVENARQHFKTRSLRLIPNIAPSGGLPRLVPMIDEGDYVFGDLLRITDDSIIKTIDEIEGVTLGRAARLLIQTVMIDQFGDEDDMKLAWAWFTLEQPPGMQIADF